MGTHPQMTEQMVTTQTTPPPPFEDEGYSHGVTLDSMIMTPRVPTLVEEPINVGIEDEIETPEETLKEFASSSSTLEKTSFMKQAGMTLIYVANALEKESESQEKMKKLAEERLGKIQSLESQLKEEKTIGAQLKHNLNKANKELQQLRKEKEMNDLICSEAFKKFEEFIVMHNKSQERVVALEKEIGQLTAAMVDMDMEKHTLSEQIKEKEQKLQSSEDVVFKQAAELEALKAKISALEKVIF